MLAYVSYYNISGWEIMILTVRCNNNIYLPFVHGYHFSYNERKKCSHFDLKFELLAELKFDPGFQVIEEYLRQIDSILGVELTIWLSILRQFNTNILQLLGILGQILVPPVTQLFRSKWLHFFFQCCRPKLQFLEQLEWPKDGGTGMMDSIPCQGGKYHS